MKSILFVIESLYCGGAEKSLVTLLQQMDVKKYEIHLLLNKKGGDFEKFVPKEVNISYNNSLANTSNFKLLIARGLFWLKKKLKKNRRYNSAHIFWQAFGPLFNTIPEKYDIAIAYSQGFSTYFVAEKVTAMKKFSWLNTDYSKAGHYATFDNEKYKKFDRVVCVSPVSETSLLNSMKSINKTLPTTIIKDITDVDQVIKMSLQERGFIKNKNEIILLTVCRLDKLKGLHLAIESCEILTKYNNNIKWYVIGEGPERENLENEIKLRKVENHFFLLGYKDNPYPYINSCDIYIQTSLYEGLGLTVIEAALLKKPIVTTNFETADSLITHKKTGLICEMNALSICKSINTYLAEPNLIKNIVKNLSEVKNTDKELSLKKFYNLIAS